MEPYLQFLCHRAGDYLLQSGWMANHKQLTNLTGWLAASVHGLVYLSCFLWWPLTQGTLAADWWRYAIVCLTHIAIDHYRVASIWAKFYNNDWSEPPVTPRWVMVEIDQTMHLIINYLCLNP